MKKLLLVVTVVLCSVFVFGCQDSNSRESVNQFANNFMTKKICRKDCSVKNVCFYFHLESAGYKGYGGTVYIPCDKVPKSIYCNECPKPKKLEKDSCNK